MVVAGGPRVRKPPRWAPLAGSGTRLHGSAGGAAAARSMAVLSSSIARAKAVTWARAPERARLASAAA